MNPVYMTGWLGQISSFSLRLRVSARNQYILIEHDDAANGLVAVADLNVRAPNGTCIEAIGNAQYGEG